MSDVTHNTAWWVAPGGSLHPPDPCPRAQDGNAGGTDEDVEVERVGLDKGVPEPRPAHLAPGVPEPAARTPGVPEPAARTPGVPEPAARTPGVPEPAVRTPGVPEPADLAPRSPPPISASSTADWLPGGPFGAEVDDVVEEETQVESMIRRFWPPLSLGNGGRAAHRVWRTDLPADVEQPQGKARRRRRFKA